jgi:hypothetical protein
LFDDLDELGAVVAAVSAELDEFDGFGEDGAALRGAGDADPVSWAEFEEAFVAQESEGAQDGVGVDVHDGREVACRREAFAGFGFAVSNRATDLRCDLIVQERWVVAVDLDIPHRASHSSAAQSEWNRRS